MYTRFTSKLILIATLSLVLLSACSPSTPSNTPATSQNSQQKTEDNQKSTETANDKKIIKTALGNIEIPAHPKRVVVQYLMGDLYAMGITPFAVSEIKDEAAFKSLASKSIDLGFHTEWSQEAVLAQDPDLIIVIEKEYYDTYSKIAPTVFIPYDNAMTMEDRLTLLGEIFNEPEKAKEVIANFHENVAQAKEKLKAAGLYDKTITVIGGNKTPYIAGKKYSIGALLYTTLGLTPPQTVQTDVIDKDKYWADLSMEVIHKYSGDYIVYLEENDKEIATQLSGDCFHLM